MSKLMTTGQLIKAVPGLTQHKYKQLESKLTLKPPRNKRGHRQFDEYWVKHLTQWMDALEHIGGNVNDIVTWVLDRPDAERVRRAIPVDDKGNVYLNRDWTRYFQTVKENLDSGKSWTWIVQELMTPNQVRPQLESIALGPEY